MNAKAQIVALLVSVSIATAYAADWPGYLGPRRDGTSTEKGLLRSWPKEGPKVLWTAPLGAGFAGPAVSRGKEYLLDRDDNVGDILRVYDLATGKERWTFAYDAPGKFEFNGSRTVPTVDGDLVYTCGPLGDLYAININTHKPVWHKNVWTDFGGGSTLLPYREPPPGVRGIQYPKPAGAPPPAPPRAAGPGGASPTTPPAPLGNVSFVSPSLVKVGTEDHLVMISATRGFGRNASGGSVNGLDPLTGAVL